MVVSARFELTGKIPDVHTILERFGMKNFSFLEEGNSLLVDLKVNSQRELNEIKRRLASKNGRQTHVKITALKRDTHEISER